MYSTYIYRSIDLSIYITLLWCKFCKLSFSSFVSFFLSVFHSFVSLLFPLLRLALVQHLRLGVPLGWVEASTWTVWLIYYDKLVFRHRCASDITSCWKWNSTFFLLAISSNTHVLHKPCHFCAWPPDRIRAEIPDNMEQWNGSSLGYVQLGTLRRAFSFWIDYELLLVWRPQADEAKLPRGRSVARANTCYQEVDLPCGFDGLKWYHHKNLG